MAKPMYRFSEGDAVRVQRRPPEAHCRTPFYLRGKTGVVVQCVGTYRDPSRLAFHKPGLPKQALYRVRFRHDQVWPDAGAATRDTIVADLYEGWLDSDKESRDAG
jgi:nitrile hydratase subunit beta